jgi:hypothetical protein
MFTRALHWSLFWASSIQSIPSHPISLRSISILTPHLCLRLTSSIFPSGFHAKILYAFLISPMYACPFHPPRLDHSSYIWLRVQVMKFLIMRFSPASYYFILCGSNILLSTLFSYTSSLCSITADEKTKGSICMEHYKINSVVGSCCPLCNGVMDSTDEHIIFYSTNKRKLLLQRKLWFGTVLRHYATSRKVAKFYSWWGHWIFQLT